MNAVSRIPEWDQLASAFDPLPQAERPRLGAQSGTTLDLPRASVAVVLRALRGSTARDLEVLLIQRAAAEGDPWSGQMAFPGGKAEADDIDATHTAARETSEEVGLDLTPATRLGALTTIDGGRATGRKLLVSAHAFGWEGQRPTLNPNQEVADALWLPVEHLTDPERRIEYHYPPAEMTFPGVQLDHPDQVIWGLTLRFLTDLQTRLGLPIPA